VYSTRAGRRSSGVAARAWRIASNASGTTSVTPMLRVAAASAPARPAIHQRSILAA
jgi:hypothetical protein